MFSTCILVCVCVAISVQILVTLAITLEDCKVDQFLQNGECRQCQECPAGQMYTHHCKLDQPCQPCPTQYYKSEKSLVDCRDCKLECPDNKAVIHPCNATHNLKCSQCKKGEYTWRDGSCVACSQCLGDTLDDQYIKKFVQPECRNAGMINKSCRRLKTQKPSKKTTLNSFTTKTVTATTNPTFKNTRDHLVTKTVTATTNPTNPTLKNARDHLVTKTVTATTNPTFKTALVVAKRSGKKDSTHTNSGFVDPGWLVALVTILVILVILVIVFVVFKRLNIVKRIKVLLYPNSQEAPHDFVMDCDETTVVTVTDRFECSAQPNITNYAQLISNEDHDDQPDCLTCQRHISTNNGSPPAMCSCQHNEGFSAAPTSEGVNTGHGDPWVYSRQLDCTQDNKWLLSRAEMGGNAAVLNGEYVELMRSREGRKDSLTTQANNACNSQPGPAFDVEHNLEEIEVVGSNEKEMAIEEKKGEENSDTEEIATAVPVSVGTGVENTIVVIATGQHSATTASQGESELTKIKSERSRGKRKKKQPEIKKSRKASSIHEDEFSSDSLHCTCGKCSYRPYIRDLKLCHCKKCVPQPDDDLYNIIERRCLREEICKELNKKGVANWSDLSTYIRIDKQISDLQRDENPADVVLDMLRTSRPRLILADFHTILKKIKRHDIMDVIMNHHVNCMLCRRNSFDGSCQELSQSHVRTEHPKSFLDV